MALNKKSKELLAAINTAMQSDLGYAMASEAEAKQLVAENLAEVNPAIADGNKFAIRLTDAGLAEVKGDENKEEIVTDTNTDAQTETTTKTNYEVFAGGFTPSRKTRGGGRKATTYPFDALEVGGFFFIPATEAKPEPGKSIGSTVNSVVKRYANPALDEAGEPVMEEYKVKGETKSRPKLNPTRDFAVQTVEAGVVYGEWTAPSNGAVVYRTA